MFRSQVKYFFLGTGIGFLGGSMDFLLVYGPEVHPIRNLSVILGSFIVGFAMLRYKLFDVRVVTAQLLTLILLAFSFVRLVLSNSAQEIIFNIVILSVTFIVGVYLILSVRREVEQREEIQRLANNLQTANERLKELDKLKSQFLSIASHDLRAPLTAIRNFLSLLMEGTFGKLPAASEEGMRQIFERATTMSDMVDNYLNVSRIEQGRMRYDFADIDLAPVLNETVKSFNGVAQEKGLSVRFTPTTEPLKMKADEPKLREVIENLVNNAIIYTEKGSISVEVVKLPRTVRITFSDSGIGMTPETIGKLFKLFSPGDDSRKYNPKSTGVGLYISRTHVEAHKGKVWAESDGVGKGSRFIVELPLSS
jgi:signal transduction histidine kinase